jgi:plastocyanin
VLLAAFLLIADGSRAADTGRVSGTVALEPMAAPTTAGYSVRTRRPIAAPDAPRAIVYLEREDGIYPDVEPETVALVAQEGYQFRPAIVAVRRGTRVAFPNRDDEFHNVFSYSAAKRFDLGRFRKDEESPLVTFDSAGLVKVYCEIHKHMRGLVLVLDTPWFTTTDALGHFTLEAPPGNYRLRALLPSEATRAAPVSIEAGESVAVELTP